MEPASSPRTRTRTRTRTTMLGAAVAVILVLAVAAVALGDHRGKRSAASPSDHVTHASSATGAPPTPSAAAVPVGDEPRIPYIVGDTLYLGNKPQHGSFMEVQSAGRSAVAFKAGSIDLITPVVFRDGRKVAVLRDAVGGTRLSPDGSLLAWFELAGGVDQLVLRDMISGNEVARVSADERALNSDFYGNLNASSVSDDGTVVYTTDAHTYYSWRPGRVPVRVPAPPTRKAPRGFARDASYVTLNRQGDWAVWVTDRLGHNPESPESGGVTDGATFERRGDPQSRFTVKIGRAHV